MPWAFLVKPGGLPPQDPYTLFFFLLIVGPAVYLILNSVVLPCWPSHILCLARLICP